MRIQHGVALTLDDQIDALETAWHELSRIMLSATPYCILIILIIFYT